MNSSPPGQLVVATRKGLFVLGRADQSKAKAGSAAQAAPWSIQAHHFPGEPVSQFLCDSRDGSWYVALNLGHFGIKLHRSTDQGASWQALAAPALPVKPTEGPWSDDPMPWNVELVWSLVAGGTDEPGTIWAGCLPAALFKSTDHGQSWVLNKPLWEEPLRRNWMGGGYDFPGLHSILVDPRNSKSLHIAISTGGVWLTEDGGEHWRLNQGGMKATFLPEEAGGDPNMQDVHSMVRCAAAPDRLWVQHHCGMYRSDDNGEHWHGITPPAPSDFGFPVAADPTNPQRAWFVPAQADIARYPVNGEMVVNRTDDGGKTFTSFGAGLPSSGAYHLVYRHALTVCPQGKNLAMGSTTGGLWMSADAGEHWTEVSQHLPPIAQVCWLG